MADDPERSDGWRRLPLAVIGPVAITLVYLMVETLRGEEQFAPGEGAGAAARDLLAFALYGAALLAFAVRGTAKCQGGPPKAAFATVSLGVSLVLMFVAFFSQMAP